MKQGIRDSLNNIQKKSDDLSTKLSDPNITSDINQLTKLNKEYSEIKDVVEKPKVNLAPSNYAVIGRYILPSKIFHLLKISIFFSLSDIMHNLLLNFNFLFKCAA